MTGGIKGVIFDADGTLLDSMAFWTSTIYDIIAMAGIEKPSNSLIEILNPMTVSRGAAYLKAHFDIAMTVDEIVAEEHLRVLKFYETQVTLCTGMRELLSELSRMNVPMSVATATQRSLIEKAFAFTGISDHFVDIVSCSDVGRGKDKPDVFLAACEALGTKPSQTLVAEDDATAIQTAKDAGFQVFPIYENRNNGELIFNTYFKSR